MKCRLWTLVTGIVCMTLMSCGAEKPAGHPATPEMPKAAGTAAGHGSGQVIELGTNTIGPYSARASRDQGDILAGKDAPIDVWVDGANAPKVAAVRFWIGSEDAKKSIKARAEIEFPDQPNHWHTHAEIPDPLPEGARLWVEIEDEKGVVTRGSFELKA